MRNALEELGSFAVQHLRFRDLWAWVWQTGGATLAEGLVTNRNGVETLPPPLFLSLQMPAVNVTGTCLQMLHLGLSVYKKRKKKEKKVYSIPNIFSLFLRAFLQRLANGWYLGKEETFL